VDRAADADRALALVADANAGRCGLVVLDGAPGGNETVTAAAPGGARTLRSVVHAVGAHAAVLERLIGDAWIADSAETARDLARTALVPVATLGGEVWRGPHRLEGGARAERRGILETRAEVVTLREQVVAGLAEIERLHAEAAALDVAVHELDARATGHAAAEHDHEKSIVGREGDTSRIGADVARLDQRRTVVSTERSQAVEAEQAAGRRREEAALAIELHETEQRGAEQTLGEVLATLQTAREVAETAMRSVSEARAEQAALVERTSALDVEAMRLEEAARELADRIAARRQDIAATVTRREALAAGIRESEQRLDADVRDLDRLRADVRRVDEQVVELRNLFSAREHEIRGARHALESIRADVMQSEVASARAASDLAHLAQACLDAVNLTIDEVVAAVARMEDNGELVAPAKRLAAVAARDAAEEAAEEAEDAEDAAGGPAGAAIEADAVEAAATSGTAPDDEDALSPEAIISDLRQKIERLGPVNMMAIEQFDDLETRHTFLTTQRKDLLDSIAQTGEAIRKIDKTTRERFDEAFASIAAEFQNTFATLFGGGRAGLVLIDQENDTESGIDMIAQPPGKRLQNVQLLSGGEKALTAMALMFAIFKYRPSPFCLLDEIDAPLDDANIGRFVEMLQGMQSHTQFILITHNRKTMEIADRLYGVTMEEPGVSKLISVELQ
jgi:chromosome segregation protein